MGQNPVIESETSHISAHPSIWVTAYRKYLRLWINLAKTINISEEEAQDVVHGVIASILSDPAKRFESTEHIRNYIAKSVLNRAIQAKQLNGRRTSFTETIELQFAALRDDVDRADIAANAVLREAIRRLSRNHFEIIKLRFYSGLTFIEISGWLNVPISTLKSREDAAIRNIRKWLRKKGV